MNIEEQSNRNLALFYKKRLLRLHREDVSYGKIFPHKSERVHLKKHGVVYRPPDKPRWYAELTPFAKEVLSVE